MESTAQQGTEIGNVIQQQSLAPEELKAMSPKKSSEDVPTVPIQDFKIVLAGANGVGKTSLARCFADNAFSDDTPSTVGIEFTQRIVEYHGKRIVLQLWDSNGELESVSNMFPNFFRFADAVVLVYDVTDLNSVKQIPSWLALSWEYTDQGTPIFMAGTKGDKMVDSCVYEMAKDIARKEGLRLLYSVSAKTGFGVEELFFIIIDKLVDNIRTETPEILKLKKTRKLTSCCLCC